jgi:hypothetical protein
MFDRLERVVCRLEQGFDKIIEATYAVFEKVCCYGKKPPRTNFVFSCTFGSCMQIECCSLRILSRCSNKFGKHVEANPALAFFDFRREGGIEISERKSAAPWDV